MNKIDIQAQSQRIAKQARELGITQIQIAKAIGADQSQVSRVLSGKSKRASRVFNEVCNYVNSITPSMDHGAAKQNDELLEAIASVWDGSPQHASALANVIRSLGELSKCSGSGVSK
jgi:transcriptional regulator with XRE-family HTH domain